MNDTDTKRLHCHRKVMECYGTAHIFTRRANFYRSGQRLLTFLGVPVPEMPFPHLNDAKEFGERVVDGALLTLQEWRTQNREEPTGTAPSGEGEEPVGAASGEGDG